MMSSDIGWGFAGVGRRAVDLGWGSAVPSRD